jgi:hypothetical protein
VVLDVRGLSLAHAIKIAGNSARPNDGGLIRDTA